jgi:hypothetical protein
MGSQGSNWATQGNIQTALTQSQVHYPDTSVLLAESWSAAWQANPSYGYGNDSNASGGNLLSVVDGDGIEPPHGGNGQASYINNNGMNGGTSAHGIGVVSDYGGIENFAFCDGHVKAMLPGNTSPGAWYDYGENMWDARRTCETHNGYCPF